MKKITTQATITSFTNPENKNFIIQSVIECINYNNLMCEKIFDMKYALAEAINNAFSYAYPNNQGKVSVSITVYDNKVLKLKVRDYGCGIRDIAKATGIGFSIMEELSDKLTVNSTLGKGTIVTMEFQM